MIQAKLGFIGAGNMNRAIIDGLLSAGVNPQHIAVSNRSEQKLGYFADRGLTTSTSNTEVAALADVLILGVKPAQLLDVAQELKATCAATKPLVISVAAGVLTEQIAEVLGADTPIVRAMPNTPSTIGEGAAGLFANSLVNDGQRELAKTIIQACGIAVWVEQESLIDAVIAVAGSAPAYFFYILETMVDEAEKLGLNPKDAKALAVQTCLGGARLVQSTETDLATLRNNVTSPGGTTQAALASFKASGLDETLRAGMQAAVARAQEMAAEAARGR